jgi:hypothetical protein
VGEAPVAPCAARRDAYLTLCYARSSPSACDVSARGVERDPRAALAAAARRGARIAGPFEASPARAAWGGALSLLPLAWALAARGHRRERVIRVALGAAVGALLAGVPPLAALALAALIEALVPGSEVVLLGLGFFVATFVAVLAMPALAGAADAGGDAVRARVHRALALVASGMGIWTIVVGPVPGVATVWLQAAAALALAVTGYLSLRPGASHAPGLEPA